MVTMTEQQVNAKVYGIDVKSIRSIETASGWRNVRSCQQVFSAIGEAQSPLSPGKLTEALRYELEDGRTAVTPFKHLLSTSDQPSNR